MRRGFPRADQFLFGLRRAPEDLSERIDCRVDAMFENGLVGETERLLLRGLQHNRTAMQAIGYRQVVEHILGERSLSDTIALVKQNTRQFAKRQMTWFRHQLPVRWLELTAGTAEEDIARKIDAIVANSRPSVNFDSSPRPSPPPSAVHRRHYWAGGAATEDGLFEEERVKTRGRLSRGS